jgi:hypothetical protein
MVWFHSSYSTPDQSKALGTEAVSSSLPITSRIEILRGRRALCELQQAPLHLSQNTSGAAPHFRPCSRSSPHPFKGNRFTCSSHSSLPRRRHHSSTSSPMPRPPVASLDVVAATPSRKPPRRYRGCVCAADEESRILCFWMQ